MNQMSTFLLGASLVVLLQVAFAADPTAKFTPPSSFAVGKEFVAKCTIGNLVPSELPADLTGKGYSILFYFTPSDKTLNPTGQTFLLATYSVTLEPDYKTFVGIDVILFEVSAAQGDVSVFPDFEVKINPKGNKAKGQYYCAIKARKNANDLTQTEYKSNVWNGSFSAIPSVVFLAFLAIVALKFQW